MSTAEHNNGTSGPPAGAPAIKSLGDLASFIDESDAVPAAQRRYLRSAVNRARILLGNGLADIPADPRTVLRQLDRISPAMAGMSRQSYANLKSRVRTAFRHAAPHLAPARSGVKLTGAWKVLEDLLPVRERRQLSRFMRFAQAMGWSPHEIGEEHMLRFAHYLEHEVIRDNAGKVVSATRRTWNRAVGTVPGWPDRHVEPPIPKRSPYWLRLHDLPGSLQKEVRGHLHHLEHADPFLGKSAMPLAPATVEQWRILFITLASALVASGMPVDRLRSVATLVQPDNLERALRFLYARAGNRMNAQMHGLVYRARKIAPLIDLRTQDRARIEELVAAIRHQAPVGRGLTDKNRRLLENLDDPAFADRLVTLPYRLMDAAKRMTASRHAASCARDAVAVELLITCSMRLGNLVDLRLGETIRRFGKGRDARWVVDLPAEAVKNRQPLRYTLLPESGALIEWYLEHWHDHWCGPGSPWLFPGKGGKHVASALLSNNVAKRARHHVGVAITAHQFRHLAAELFLREDPNGLGVVSQHLGHRDFNTTRRFYAREQTRIATQRYHAVLTKKRQAVPARRRRTTKPHGERA